MNLLLRRCLTALIIASAACTSAEPEVTGKPSARDLKVVQKPMAELQPPPSDFQVSAWVNDPDNTYRFGEKVTISVKTNQDAYLTILNVGTSGKVHVIFPNQHQRDNRVNAEQAIQVPASDANFDIEVSGPAGTEQIRVIATEYPDPIFKPGSLEPAGPYQAHRQLASAVARDLKVVLRDRHRNQWAAADVFIRVKPPNP